MLQVKFVYTVSQNAFKCKRRKHKNKETAIN